MQRWIKKYTKHYLMILPFFALYSIFFIWPAIWGIYISFNRWDSVHAPHWIGLANYASILSSPAFKIAFTNLLKYVAIAIPLGVVLAFALAVLVDSYKEGIWGKIFRSAYFIPVMIPLFLTASIWKWLYSPDVGFLNTLLGILHMGHVRWLSDPKVMIYSLVIVDAWASVGFNMLILLGGMKNIPSEYYDAAKIDGANKFQEIIYVMIPQLEPVLFLVIVYGFISALQVFDIPWILTQSTFDTYGGQQYGLLFPVMAMMAGAFNNLKFGYASAYGLLLMLFILILTLFQFSLRRRQAYE
jgi:multiple sugar transport system permease protein